MNKCIYIIFLPLHTVEDGYCMKHIINPTWHDKLYREERYKIKSHILTMYDSRRG
jgi:hypothetical protein